MRQRTSALDEPDAEPDGLLPLVVETSDEVADVLGEGLVGVLGVGLAEPEPEKEVTLSVPPPPLGAAEVPQPATRVSRAAASTDRLHVRGRTASTSGSREGRVRRYAGPRPWQVTHNATASPDGY